MTKHRALGLITLCLALALGAAACSAKDSASEAPAAGAWQGGGADSKAGNDLDSAARDEAAAPREGGTAGSAPGGTANAPQAGETDRAIIYTGTLTVEVPDVAGAADKAVALVTGAQGYVGADKRSVYSSPDAHAQLVLRVPAASFATTLDTLAKLGKELDRSSQASDVTEAVIDLDTRIASQQASLNRTRALMAKANTIGEIVSVESELTKRETELATLQARKRDMANKVSYSTITLMLQTARKVEPAPGPEKDETGFLAGLKAGWHAFVTAVQVALTILGALLPFLIAVAIPVGLYLWLRRRRAVPASAAKPVQQGGELDGEGR
ncbi:DUF4349 domain-containing protein [Luedemannella helvata]|uniref:DUF4349 domain-containing protein n=1 Tax=Luedemannella helvata TaxID=349315 RepID=A0ABP4VQE3_9ACTN